ncbi:hypothetical protein ACGF13_12330 [Kitasatospora sp. NPDC048286]|uniref:hypothetical protein n=1 Tax=Kitasatospora sp. NPDC048286 TaxID=3364047 RepID=UPI00371A6968
MTELQFTGERVWRPYDDDPLTTREMISGLEACDLGTRNRLLSYLEALVTHRSAPVHTAVAFNAVYFGYDMSVGGYAGGPLDIGTFPSVALGDQVVALPVGAMINIRTAGDLLPAEIVYKEGAHPELGPYGETPDWLSGAPAGAHGPGRLASDPTAAPVLRERLVFDTTAFGQDPAPTAIRLQRLRRQGRTDELGHLVVESQYATTDGDLGDTDYYARYLVTQGRDQLTSALAPAPLPSLIAPGSGEDELLAAARGLMGTVREALASLEAVRVWGEYVFTRDSMARRLTGAGALGRDDLGRLAESTANHALPRSDRRTRVGGPKPVYTAVGAVLRSRTEWQDEIRGTGYPLAVCHANSVLTDYARRERDEATDLLPSGVRLALDDHWQGGGVWRAAYEGRGIAMTSAEGWSDDMLGRGWAESFPRPAPGRRSVPEPEPEPELPNQEQEQEPDPADDGAEEPGTVVVPAPDPWPDDSDLGAPDVFSVNDCQVEWAQPLRLAHLMDDCLPLPRDLAEEFRAPGAPAGPVRVLLQHAGQELPPAVARHDTSLTGGGADVRLTGLVWPWEFFPGIWLSFTWQRGSRVVHARTILLPHPVTVDGDLIAHRYDPKVLTRDAVGGLSRDTGNAEDRSAVRLLMTAVRRLGLLDQFGRAMLARVEVPPALEAVMGGAMLTVGQIEGALVDLLALRRLTTTRGSRGLDGRTYYPPRAGRPLEELVCYTPHRVELRGGRPGVGPAPAGPIPSAQPAQEHDVAGFLRRIGHLGHEATDEQRALYHADHRRFRLTGPSELPAGYTYVRPHRRSR